MNQSQLDLEKIIYYGSTQGAYDDSLLPQDFYDSSVEELKKACLIDQRLRRYLPSERQEKEDQHTLICRYLAYKWSQRETQRLGYQEAPDIISLHYQLCIIETVSRATNESYGAFEDRIIESGNKYGFFLDTPYKQPEMMWQVLAEKQDGDALLMMVGDDRENNEHLIVVQWCPARFDFRLGLK